MPDTPTVMISSTARDLPDYRQQVMDACLRAGMLPKMMEHLPALDADAIEASLALVDEADVYLGIFAHRYGYVPAGHDISITQVEYERAVERNLPRLIFLMDEEVLVRPKDVDKGESADKLGALKERLEKERVVAFFKNPDDLRAQALQSLSEIKRRLEAETGQSAGEMLAGSRQYVSPIPAPPEPYVAHPYTLLQVRGLIGRQAELEQLTDWVTRPAFAQTRIFTVVAIGGMGKSALTWSWFNDIAPQEMPRLAGRLWWSFYESDATFENFVTRALAYVSRQPLDAVKQMPFPEQQQALLQILDREPFLLVLDGLERILIAYARQDAAYLQDDSALDDETANRVAGALGLPPSAGQAYVGRHQLRKTADVRVGQFLRRLAQVRAARILVSSRLYPADLQTPLGAPLPGCAALFLKGLSDPDALELWRAYGAKGSREAMLPVFRSFDKHPLLLQLLAYEVAEFRDAPGDFDAWRAANPEFDPFGLPLVQVQSHVLACALNGLSPAELRTLHVLAGFRLPSSMETIKALLIRQDEGDEPDNQPFATLGELDTALTTLEDRGLLGWDRRANRYDLHPIVRGVVWNGLGDTGRSDIYTTLQTHFEAMPQIEDWQKVESLEDLTPAIELYHTLVGLEQFDAAFELFRDRLASAMLWRLSANRLRVELLERFFPDGPDTLPRLSRASQQGYTLNELALGYQYSGQASKAIPLFERAIEIRKRENDHHNHRVNLCNLSDARSLSGCLYSAETAACVALIISRERENRFHEGVSLEILGSALAIRGLSGEAVTALRRSLRLFVAQSMQQCEGIVNASLAERALWLGEAEGAWPLAERAWRLAAIYRSERDFIQAARVWGSAALHLNDLDIADERLHHALTRARAVQLFEEELPTLIALAELRRRQGQPGQARELLEDV